MGTVYEAEQDQPNRKVALKVIRPDLVSPQLVRRFLRESEVLGRLQHPGIAQIYEAGASEGAQGPQPFFAMELVKGVSLDSYAHDRKLSVSQRVELFISICEAVHYAHQKGVIHRDLKPGNILVDATGQPKILDFGVARLADTETQQATRQTTLGQLVGTLQYMSPEQVNADPLDIDTRSDVYSLGVILYELLAERLPYDISRHVLHEAAWVILQVDPAPLSSVNRNLRGDVETIVSKALEKEKDRRYSSADELASDLKRFLTHQPISARPASAMYQLRKFAQRNRALVGGLTLAAVILVIGTAVSIMLAIRATAAERLAESRRAEAEESGKLAEERRAEATAAVLVADSARADAQREQLAASLSAEHARQEADKAQAVSGFLQQMLTSADPSNARGKELTVREMLDVAAASERSGDLTRQPQVRASVDAAIGTSYYGLGLFEQARPHLDTAYILHRRASGGNSIDFATAADNLGQLAQSTGDYSAAARRLEEALAVMRRQLPPNDDRVTSTMMSLASALYSQGMNSEADTLYREALSLTRSRHGDEGDAMADRMRRYGNYLNYLGRHKEALAMLDQSLTLLRRVHGKDHPRVITGLTALADVRSNIGEYVAAEALLREALASAQSRYPAEHPSTASILSRLGDAMTDQRKLEQAEPMVAKALAMRIKLLGSQHPDVQLSRTELARLYQRQQRFAAAESLLIQALASRQQVLGPASPGVAATLQDIGLNHEQREDWAGAEARYREALPIFGAAKATSDETSVMASLGWVLSKQNKLAEADSLLNAVLIRRRAEKGVNDRSVGDTYEKLAGVAIARGDIAAAESLSLAGLAIRRVVYGEKAPQVADQLLNIAFLREKQNDSIGAIPALRESVAITSGVRPAGDPNLVFAQQWLAVDLCTTGQAAEGEALLRSAMAALPVDTTRTMPYRVRTNLGYCLMKQQKFAEAEPLMIEAESRLRSIPNVAVWQKLAIQRLVELYNTWGKAPEAMAWRGKLTSPGQ